MDIIFVFAFSSQMIALSHTLDRVIHHWLYSHTVTLVLYASKHMTLFVNSILQREISLHFMHSVYLSETFFLMGDFFASLWMRTNNSCMINNEEYHP